MQHFEALHSNFEAHALMQRKWSTPTFASLKRVCNDKETMLRDKNLYNSIKADIKANLRTLN